MRPQVGTLGPMGRLRVDRCAGWRPVLALLATLAGIGAAGGTAAAAVLKAEAVLPPGESGYVSGAGVADGTGSPHLTDQTDLFKSFQLRPFGFDQPGQSESPRPGVKITRDTYGVPRIDASSDTGAWWGVGYAAAQDRLFQMELFRRAGAGTLSEILGSTYLDDDLIARRDYYTDSEVDAMVAKVPAELQQRLIAYRDGINAYIAYLHTHPDQTPGEFTALGVPLRDWTVRDSARIGILLARTVPSGDGNELENAQVLEKIGPDNFDYLHPVRTKGRLPTIPKGEGKFKAQPGRTRRDERAGYKRTQRYLKTIDVGASGPGTTTVSGGGTGVASALSDSPGADLARILPHGGSFMWAIRDRERKRAYLFNGPQLGFTIPELFWEFELHSPDQDIRGVSAAGIPVVGIGHNGKVGWGFTLGLSDEDDLFAVRTAGSDDSYTFKGKTEQMSCRDETFNYKTPPTGLPGLIDDPGLPAGSTTQRICRTSQGPVQFRGDGVAYARRYAIWGRELETIVGLTELNDAKNIKAVDKSMDDVSWNENVIAADSRGRIGYWHPGLQPLRSKRWDERLPFPGDGRAEWRGLLPPDKRPQLVNPKRDWLASWNNPPSIGWTNGDGPARERLAGNLHRVRLLRSLVSKVARRPSYARSRSIELTSGQTAQQFPFANRKRLRKARKRSDGTAAETISALLAWDGNYTRTDGNGTIAPGVSIWESFKDELETRMLARHGGDAARPLTGETSTSHEYDITNGEAIAMRALGPKGYARAARATATKLADRFETRDVSAWRAPRLMYDVASQGAASAPELPFFDRGTWSQSLELGKPGG